VRWLRPGVALACLWTAASCDGGDDEEDGGAAGEQAVAYLILDRDGDAIVGFRDLVPVTVDADGLDPVERIRVALLASAEPADAFLDEGADPPLAPEAVPEVTLRGDLVVLDYSSEAASDELGSWGTSSGGTALNAIAGMVFENAPDVQRIEQRVDGSCVEFTERMQGVGCHHDTRDRWQRYRAMAP
jgi:hypothetical protein